MLLLTSHFLQLQLWCWAYGTLRSADLGWKNTMEANPKRCVPVYLSYMVRTGSISHCVLGEGTEKLRDSLIYSKFIDANSDGIHLFLIYFCFVNLPIFLFECVCVFEMNKELGICLCKSTHKLKKQTPSFDRKGCCSKNCL